MLINHKNYLSYFITTYLAFFAAISYSCEEAFDNKTSKETVSIEVLNQRIFDYLDFDFITIKMKNQMRNNFRLSNTFYIGELIQKSEQDLLRISGFGRHQLNAIRKALTQKDLHLSTQLANPWTPPQQKEHIATNVLNQRIFDYLDFDSIPLHIRARINKVLEANNIIYIGELIQKSEYELSYLHLENITKAFNQKIIDTLVEILKQKGLHLSTTLANPWTPPQQKKHIATNVLNQIIFDYLDFSFIDSAIKIRLKINLEKEDIHYIGELIQKNEMQLFRIPGIGVKQISLFKKALKQRDLYLNTQLAKPWTRPQIKNSYPHTRKAKSPADLQKDTPPESQKMHIATDILNQRVFHYLNINFLAPKIRTRIIRAFRVNNIIYIGDLIQRSEQDLLNLRLGIIDPPINHKTLRIIIEVLRQRDLYLNTQLAEPWIRPST